MQTTTIRRRLAGALVATAMLTTALPGAALAGVSERSSFVGGFFYTDGTDGSMLLLTGPALAEGCVGDGFPEGPAHLVRPGGKEHVQFTIETPIMLFDMAAVGATNPYEFLGIACGAALGGGDVPEPVATGSGTLRGVGTCDTAGGACFEPGSFLHWNNFVHGTLHMDGEQVQVNARAIVDVTFAEQGAYEDPQLLRLQLS